MNAAQVMFPVTIAEGFRITRWAADTLPLTRPSTMTVSPCTSAVTCPPAPMVRVWLTLILPSTFPSMSRSSSPVISPLILTFLPISEAPERTDAASGPSPRTRAGAAGGPSLGWSFLNNGIDVTSPQIWCAFILTAGLPNVNDLGAKRPELRGATAAV